MFTLPPTDTHTHELGRQCVYVMATSVSTAFQHGKKNQSIRFLINHFNERVKNG